MHLCKKSEHLWTKFCVWSCQLVVAVPVWKQTVSSYLRGSKYLVPVNTQKRKASTWAAATEEVGHMSPETPSPSLHHTLARSSSSQEYNKFEVRPNTPIECESLESPAYSYCAIVAIVAYVWLLFSCALSKLLTEIKVEPSELSRPVASLLRQDGRTCETTDTAEAARNDERVGKLTYQLVVGQHSAPPQQKSVNIQEKATNPHPASWKSVRKHGFGCGFKEEIRGAFYILGGSKMYSILMQIYLHSQNAKLSAVSCWHTLAWQSF